MCVCLCLCNCFFNNMSEFPFQVKVPVNHVGLTLFSTLIKSACLMFKPYLRLSTRLPRAVTGMGMFLLHHHSCRHAEACRLGVQQGSQIHECFVARLQQWQQRSWCVVSGMFLFLFAKMGCKYMCPFPPLQVSDDEESQ